MRDQYAPLARKERSRGWTVDGISEGAAGGLQFPFR
jgi:hypothetical protein